MSKRIVFTEEELSELTERIIRLYAALTNTRPDKTAIELTKNHVIVERELGEIKSTELERIK